MNLHDDGPDVEREAFGATQRFWHIGRRLGGELIGATMFEVQPGYRGPYHLHHGNEEWVLVVGGTPTLRMPDGERTLREGDIAVFPRGEAGLHSLDNPSDAPARFVVFSSMVDPDVTERPEEGLVGVFAGAVPTMGLDAPFEAFFPRDAAGRG
jgi:uncharacterized cupin superfamily protein